MVNNKIRAEQAPPNLTRKRWSIAFAAALMNALQSGGFFFTPTTLMPLIITDFNLPLSVSTVPIAVGKVAYVLLLIPGGMLVDHYGPRRCVLVGIAGLATMMTMYALYVSSFWLMLATHIIMASVASVSGVPVYSIFIAQWFEGGIGLAMGLVLAGYSAAGTAIPALLGPVANMFGWRVAMGCMCGLLWFVALPVTYFFLQEYKYTDEQMMSQLEEGESITDSDTAQPDTSHVVQAEQRSAGIPGGLPDTGLADSRSWTFVGFACSYILLQYCFGCFGENILFFLTIDRELTIGVASLFFSALNFSAFAAKIVGGHLGDRFDRFHVASAASGLAASGIAFLFLGSAGLDENGIPRLTVHPMAVLSFTVLFGFGYGATFNCLYALTPIIFGKKNLGRTQSALFGLGLAGNAVGSVLTGVLRSKYETYQRPFLLAATACTANFFVFNVTRLTLGGSLRGLKAMHAEQQGLSESFADASQLDAAEEAARLRIGSETGTPEASPKSSPQLSPPSSYTSLPRMPTTYGAAFVPASGSLLNTTRNALSTSTSFAALSREKGSGMQVEGGFPIVRDWSSSSLRAHMRRSASASGTPRRQLRKSSTMEAIIESGILSASLEAAGYLGKSPMASQARTPVSATPGSSFVGSPLLLSRFAPEASQRDSNGDA